MVSVTSGLNVPSHASAHLTHRRQAQSSQPPSDETASTITGDSTTDNDGAADFRKLFSGVTTPETSTSTQTTNAPTAESVFGDNPWITNPTGMGPAGTYSFNPIFFATEQTAEKVAQMLGGKVVQSNELASGGNFMQQQPNQMIELPNGKTVNAGLVAAFYTHGYPQSYIDQLIASTISDT